MTDLRRVDPVRADGLLLGAAVGDALGWPQEDRSSIIGGNKARQVEPAMQFRSWRRHGGTQYQRYVELIGEGEYSDDTQLLAATARACLRGKDWLDWLRRVELPMWPLYQRGGGAAVLRSSRAWSEGRAPWQGSAQKARALASSYFQAGANGVAMRIAPHVVVTAGDPTPERLLARCLMDGLSTHGHPRAHIGGLVYALAVRTALTQEDTLGYGTLLESVLSEPTWQEADFFLHHVQISDPDWVDAYRREIPRGHPGTAWSDAVQEMRGLLEECLNSLSAGSMAKDEKTLDSLGVFSKFKGSGTITAAATLYVAARTAARPHTGLLRTAFLRSADTDTLASMTAGLLGALHGTNWLGGLDHMVQDSSYLRMLADQLARGYSSPVGGQQELIPVGRLATAQVKHFIERVFTDPDAVAGLPDGREFRVLDMRSLASKGQSQVQELVLRTRDGQTIFLTQVKKGGSPASPAHDREADRTEDRTQASSPPRAASPRFSGLQIQVRSLDRARTFYSEVLGLAATPREQTVWLEGGLVLRGASGDPENDANRAVLIAVQVPDLQEIEGRLRAGGYPGPVERGHNRLTVRDPDGYHVQLFTTTHT